MNEIIENESAICEICGCTHKNLYEVGVGGIIRSVCADCAEAEGFVQCVDCGEWVKEEDSYGAYHGAICQSCFEDEYFVCDHCDEVHHIVDMVSINSGTSGEAYWCEECVSNHAYKCEECGGYFTRGYIDLVDDDYNAVCDSCNRHGTWHICGDCGALFNEDDGGGYHDDDEEWYCDRCYSNHTHSSELHSYNYKPYPVFKTRKGEALDSALTFGVELEVDRGADADKLCDKLAELDQPIYMKHDGSLGSEGVEIVTHPCSLAYHTYELRWSAITKVCTGDGYRSHDTNTCGLHIHVGRQQMGIDNEARKVTAGNLVLLTNTLWDKLVPFTRRELGCLERWACRNRIPNTDILEAMSNDQLTETALRTVVDGRYQAVNLNNGETVEFRIFRGTLKRETLIAAIQLVSNLTKYAMTHTPKECLNATWSDVLSIQEHKELKAYVLERGLA